MELGLGIHGEPGAWRGPAQPIDAIIAQVRRGPLLTTRLARLCTPLDGIVGQVCRVVVFLFTLLVRKLSCDCSLPSLCVSQRRLC